MNIKHSSELRALYLKFFQSKGHAVIPGASVIPENDPTVLFTTAGMHPLVPYLLGAKHPDGHAPDGCAKVHPHRAISTRWAMLSHCTFFEMLGNWSLGDYFKKEAIALELGILDQPRMAGHLIRTRLAFSVFAGDEDCPRDDEAANYWRECGVQEDHIFFLPKKNNWWGPAGMTGPCGPDTEMFIITDKPPCGPDCSPACDCGRYLEIWNDVFMQYDKQADGSFLPLKQKNVDTGMGLERTISVLMGAKSVYETDLFADILAKIGEISGKAYGESEEVTRSMRIVADHMRTATFIIGDDQRRNPLERGPGLCAAPPDSPRRAARHAAGHAGKLHRRNRQGHHQPV